MTDKINQDSVIIHVAGNVQGVGFRFFTVKKAKQLDLNGYVKNLTNGEVEIVLCGKISKISEMISWLEKGVPNSAKISHYNIKEYTPKENFQSFGVRY
ncbi:acylphosphatase [Orbaceae bacterium ac157xtp]